MNADAGAKTFSVPDFGAKPDDGQDDTAAIRATIAAAAGQAASIILLPRGQYDVHDAAGAEMGIVAVGTENLTLSHVRVMPRPGTSRLVSTTADATHFINCSGTVTLEGCHFEGMGDDHLNVHGPYEFVHRRLDARTFEARIGTLAGFGQWPEAWVWGWAAAPKCDDPLEFFPSAESRGHGQGASGEPSV